ncbi:MAG: tetratricopeptide repeat protein [Planctomycetaceae bacterium]
MPWFNPYRTHANEPVSPAGYVLRFPAYVLWTLWGFVVSWGETRDYRRLWQGLPAVLLAGLLVLLLLWQSRPASRELIESYRDKVQQATRTEEFDLADFYFRKLEQLAPGDTRIRFEHALLYAARDDYVHAAHLMQSLVQDEDRSDDAKVHLWLARTALEGRLELEEPLAFAKTHLNKLLEDDPHDRYAHYFFAQLFLRSNDLDNAIRHLEPVATQSSELKLQLATLYGMQGDRTRARSLAREAANLLEKEINNTQTADVSTWVRLAASYLVLQEYPQAVSILKQAVTKFDDQECRKMLGRAYVHWSDEVFAKTPTDIARRLELLQDALQIAPDEPLALQRIVEIAGTDGPAADEAKSQLQSALAEGRATAVIHFTLGTMEAGKGNMEAALRHLNQAQAANPQTAVTLNNLAFVLSRQESPDLERALEVSNQAVRIAPNVASFRETRGQILTSLGRYADAITDLEFALPSIPRPATQLNIHRSLSTCYKQLGDNDLSQIHERKAEQLQAEQSQADSGSRTNQPTLDDVERALGIPADDEPSPPSEQPPRDSDG